MRRCIGPRKWAVTRSSWAVSVLTSLLSVAPAPAGRLDPALEATVALDSYAPRAPEDRQPAERLAVGGGIVIDAAAGQILTVHHIVGDAGRVVARWRGGRALEAERLGWDKTSDLAVLRVPADGLTAAPLALEPPAVGTEVYAVGHPFDQFLFSVTKGIISATGRRFAVGGRRYRELLQTDAAMNRGNSGGPLLDGEGRVVGLQVAIYSPTAANAGIGFALPIAEALLRAEHLARDGVLPYTGLVIDDLTPELASERGLPYTPGPVVLAVDFNSPAATAGLLADDRPVAVADTAVTTTSAFERALLTHRLGEHVPLTVTRGDQRLTRPVTLSRPPGR